MSHSVVRTAVLFLLAMSIGAPVLHAQSPPKKDTDKGNLESGWHVVRPGETLQSITAFYLGSSALWEQNHRLNPELADPHRIYPGQRLRILLPHPLPERTARLIEVSNQVDDRLRPNPWADAWHDDLLRPQDGVRTFERSSAELAFGDGTRLLLTEQSLVFLWGGPAAQTKVERKSIEVVEGQADLEFKAAPASAAGLEIVLGDATAKPRPSPAGTLQTRARRPDTGGAQLMVYGGESELEAAGRTLTVPQGMGSNVPAGAPPSPPEKLLPEAAHEHPPRRGQLALADLELRWQVVEGARSYSVEVCGDERCAQLIAKAKGLETNTWKAEALPLGPLFWRVTAVSPSGLDGYPSPAQPFEVVTELASPTPGPAPAVEIAIGFLGPQSACGGRLVIGPGAEPVLEPAAAVASARWSLDGQQLARADFGAALTAGAHELVAVVVDTAGREQRSAPLAFIYDPDPPVIRWGRSGGLELASSDDSPVAAASASRGSELAELEWRTGTSDWIELGPQALHYFADKPWVMLYGERGWWLRRVRQGRRVVFEQPRIELRNAGQRVALGELVLGKREGLWIEAGETTCRVESLTFRLGGREEKPRRLELDATDSVGNRTRLAWPVSSP